MSKTAVQVIAIFVPSLYGGGAEKVAVTLANGFSTRGYEVDLITLSSAGEGSYWLSGQVRVVNLNVSRMLKALPGLVCYLRNRRPSVLLSVLSHSNLIAILARNIARVSTRLIVSEHTNPTAYYKFSGSWRSKLVLRALPYFYTRADAIVAVSQSVARDLERLVEIAPRTVRVIYNPFDIASIERAARENPFHKWLEPGQPPVIIAVGRLSIEKDFHTLIDAFVKIRRSRIARLLILGDGPLRSQLVSYAVHRGLNKDDFMLVGYKPNPFAYMSRSRVLVLSSCLEGFGNVLVEAMACGVPVVSTDCIGAPREILEDGKWGKLVPVGDSDALSVAVEGVMRASSRDLPNYQERAKEFDIKYAVDAYLDLFKPPTGAADE